MEEVRIGLVGCGGYGICHLEALASIPGVEIAAVYDVDRRRAESAARQHSVPRVCDSLEAARQHSVPRVCDSIEAAQQHSVPRVCDSLEAAQQHSVPRVCDSLEAARQHSVPRVCDSLEEICGMSGLAAIDVVATETAHYAPVMAAIAGGKHVFVEKPLATVVDECAHMIEAAAAKGRILMVGHLLRFETKYVQIKREVDSGRLGKIVSIHARRNRPKTLLPVYGRTHPALENCIHDVDLMLWYTGQRVARVRGYGRKITGGRNDDTFWGMLEFADGALGVVETIWLLPETGGVQFDDALQVIGTRGVANLELFPGPLSFWRENGHEVPDVSYASVLRDELMHFCDCVRAGRQPETITPVEAMRAVQVSLALVESARLGRDVEIPEWDGHVAAPRSITSL